MSDPNREPIVEVNEDSPIFSPAPCEHEWITSGSKYVRNEHNEEVNVLLRKCSKCKEDEPTT